MGLLEKFSTPHFFFFYEKILQAPKAPKAQKAQKVQKTLKTLKHKNATKQKHKKHKNTNKRISDFFPLDVF